MKNSFSNHLPCLLAWGSMDGTVLRALPSQCVLGSILRPRSYMGWVCCWFSFLLHGFFSRFSSFPPCAKINSFKVQFDLEISPWFSPGSNNPDGQNLAGILPRISPRFSLRSKFTVAKILVRSCRESRQNWRREAKFLVRNFRHAATNFCWIDPNVYVLEIN